MTAFVFRLAIIFLILGSILASVAPLAMPVAAQTTNETYQEVRRSYRGQLDEYRTADRQYQIALEQYSQLRTLASLEELILQTHTAMKLRNQVLVSYLTLLQLQMEVSTGINLDQKNQTIEALKSDIRNIEAFQGRIQGEPTRQLITQYAVEFESLAANLETDAYLAQTLLAHGKLQTVYDKTGILHQEIESVTKEKQDIAQSERQRANQEIRNTLTGVKEIIDEMNAEINRSKDQFSKGNFDGSQDDLTKIYSGLSQTLSYLEELLRI